MTPAAWAARRRVADDSLTFPQRVALAAEIEPDRVAMRQKRGGVYHDTTWGSYAEEMRDVAAGLAALGVEPQDRVTIMGDPRVEMAVAEMGVLALGAVAVGIYATSAVAEIRYTVEHAGATVLIAEAREHLDKTLAALEELPAVRGVVVLDPGARSGVDHPLVIGYEELLERGRALRREQPGAIERQIAAGTADDPTFILYTSGTTGVPKGVVHTHRTYYHSGRGYILGSPDIATKPHRHAAHLSLAHGVGLCVDICLPTMSMLVPCFPENPKDVAGSLKDVEPTYMILVPRFYQKFSVQALVAIRAGSPLKRTAYDLAMRVGRRVREARVERRRIPPATLALYGLARLLVFRPLLASMGFQHLPHALTGSASMPRDVHALWQTWGLDLREVYGQTEGGGLTLAYVEAWQRPGTIGAPMRDPAFEVSVADDGEILLRTPCNFVAYWGDPEATANAFVGDGWLATGDIAEVTDEGLYRLLDRKKAFLKTAGGKRISPQQIENELKQSPVISEAVVVGDGRKYLVALIEIEFDTLSELARERGVRASSREELIAAPEVVEHIRQEIAAANENLARPEQIKDFRIMPVELGPEHGTTATRKIQRRRVEELFADMIAAMYRSSDYEEQLIRAEAER